ncbi:MAG: hypothetical protein ACKO86_31470, partial [Dolichospermum sp.]
MNKTIIPHISMRGIAIALPEKTEFNHQLFDVLDYEDIQRVSQTIGIYSRKFASKEITAFNLMFQAIKNLLKTTNISKK